MASATEWESSRKSHCQVPWDGSVLQEFIPDSAGEDPQPVWGGSVHGFQMGGARDPYKVDASLTSRTALTSSNLKQKQHPPPGFPPGSCLRLLPLGRVRSSARRPLLGALQLQEPASRRNWSEGSLPRLIFPPLLVSDTCDFQNLAAETRALVCHQRLEPALDSLESRRTLTPTRRLPSRTSKELQLPQAGQTLTSWALKPLLPPQNSWASKEPPENMQLSEYRLGTLHRPPWLMTHFSQKINEF